MCDESLGESCVMSHVGESDLKQSTTMIQYGMMESRMSIVITLKNYYNCYNNDNK